MKRPSAVSLIASLIWLLTAVPGRTAPQPDPCEACALKIVNKTYDSETGVLEFDLWNTGDKTVTAWNVLVVTGSARGREARRWIGKDFWWQLIPGREQEASVTEATGEGLIYPDARLRQRMQVGLPKEPGTFPVLVVRLEAVVYHDATAEGSAQRSQEILANRAAAVEQAGSALTWLNQLLAEHGATAAALPSLRTKVAELAQPRRIDLPEGTDHLAAAAIRGASGFRQQFRDNLQALAVAIERDAASAQDELDHLLALLEREYTVGLQHVPLAMRTPAPR
jgi:hypothetical protein